MDLLKLSLSNFGVVVAASLVAYEGVGPLVGGFFTRSCDNFLN
jgi:hypothetical protein